jgi:hypothetical protein
MFAPDWDSLDLGNDVRTCPFYDSALCGSYTGQRLGQSVFMELNLLIMQDWFNRPWDATQLDSAAMTSGIGEESVQNQMILQHILKDWNLGFSRNLIFYLRNPPINSPNFSKRRLYQLQNRGKLIGPLWKKWLDIYGQRFFLFAIAIGLGLTLR